MGHYTHYTTEERELSRVMIAQGFSFRAIALKLNRLRINQRELADRLQKDGLLMDKNAVQRIESEQRFVTDIELIYLSKVLNVTINDLLGI